MSRHQIKLYVFVEKTLTWNFAPEGELINTINKKLPVESICIINEWIHCKRNSEFLRLPKTYIGNVMPDATICKKDDCSNEYKLFVSNKLKVEE